MRPLEERYVRIELAAKAIGIFSHSPVNLECKIARVLIRTVCRPIDTSLFLRLYGRLQWELYRRGMLWIEEEVRYERKCLVIRFIMRKNIFGPKYPI